MADRPECTCLPFLETFHRGISGKPVPRCELHSLGSAGNQNDPDSLALNSEQLENRLRDALDAAANKPPTLEL